MKERVSAKALPAECPLLAWPVVPVKNRLNVAILNVSLALETGP